MSQQLEVSGLAVPSRSSTTEARRLLERIRAAQASVTAAECGRDVLVRQALDAGYGVRAVADVLGVDKGTVSRRYNRGRAER
jgi:DNA-directed RNA polymerase specialized sigma24 family protein